MASFENWQYQPVPLHFKVPHGIFIHEATSVAVDSRDNVYCFNRGNMPILVFDEDGNLLRHWGNPTPFEGTETFTDPYGNEAARWIGCEFLRPHMITIDHEDNVWLVDDIANVITKCDLHGNRLMMLGPHGLVETGSEAMQDLVGKQVPPAESQSGKCFNRPTDVAIDPENGDIFISDGYGNSRIHRLKADGSPIQSWGQSGTDPGDFNIPHSIAFNVKHRHVYVADRENSRVQIFSTDGKLIDIIHAHRAVSVAVHPSGVALVAEQGSTSGVQKGKGYQISALKTWTKNIGHRVGFYSFDETSQSTSLGKSLGAATPGERPEQFNWLHSVAMNSKHDVYAAEVSFCECGKHQKPHARELVSLRKWKRVDLQA